MVLERGRRARVRTARCPLRTVTLLVEVVSKSSVDRDYGLKRSIYAAGRVPAYLIIDPYDARCVLLTEPVGAGEEADYDGAAHRLSSAILCRWTPLGIELDTTEFGTLPAVRPHRRP